MTIPIEAEMDKIRWRLIELFKQELHGKQPVVISRDEGDFYVNEHGICHPSAGTEFKSFPFYDPQPWEKMSWEYLACVAEYFSSME